MSENDATPSFATQSRIERTGCLLLLAREALKARKSNTNRQSSTWFELNTTSEVKQGLVT